MLVHLIFILETCTDIDKCVLSVVFRSASRPLCKRRRRGASPFTPPSHRCQLFLPLNTITSHSVANMQLLFWNLEWLWCCVRRLTPELPTGTGTATGMCSPPQEPGGALPHSLPERLPAPRSRLFLPPASCLPPRAAAGPSGMLSLGPDSLQLLLCRFQPPRSVERSRAAAL